MAKNNLCDYHIHTHYSSDSSEKPENIIRHAIDSGLAEICFTDHMDLGYPYTTEYENPAFVFDTEAYYRELSALRDKYAGDIKIKIGVELGLIPYLKERNKAVADSVPFDFIIGSTHQIDGKDPYYPEFWARRDCDDVVNEYFVLTYDNVRTYSDYDVYGHLDYITRYAPDKSYRFDYMKHFDIIDCILKEIIRTGHGIELNTSPLCKGLDRTNPCPEIVKRYKELGGETITIGSDAHIFKNVGGHFDTAREILLSCGFKYYSVFTDRKMEMRSI